MGDSRSRGITKKERLALRPAVVVRIAMLVAWSARIEGGGLGIVAARWVRFPGGFVQSEV